MLASELVEKLNLIRELTDKNNKLLQIIDRFAKPFNNIYINNQELISLDPNNGTQGSKIKNGLLTLLADGITSPLTNSYDIEDTINLVNDYREKLRRYKSLPTGSILFDEIETNITDFLSTYKVIHKTSVHQKAYTLAKISYDLTIRLDYLSKFLDDFLGVILGHLGNQTADEQEQSKAIEIGFACKSTASNVVVKVHLLNEIYLDVCKIVKVDSDIYPLKVVKLQTGSFDVFLQGAITAIPVLATVLGVYINYLIQKQQFAGRVDPGFELWLKAKESGLKESDIDVNEIKRFGDKLVKLKAFWCTLVL